MALCARLSDDRSPGGGRGNWTSTAGGGNRPGSTRVPKATGASGHKTVK